MRNEEPFGVLLILEGTEVGSAGATGTALIGTLARIVDWYQGSDGILGITAVGTDKFRLRSVQQQSDGLYLGEITVLSPEPACKLPPDYEPMAELLRAILDDLGKLYGSLPRRYDDASWVGYRFSEVLPMPVEQKQIWLECEDAIERLDAVRPLLRTVRWETSQ
jgi:Lon protease-like protein